MSLIYKPSSQRAEAIHPSEAAAACEPPLPLRVSVEQALERYFEHLDGQGVCGLYDLVLAEVEAPLLAVTLSHVEGNQSKAAQLLGLNRGTLRKKLKQYDLL